MNLDRIHFKVQNDELLILNQISELKKLNLVIKFDKSQYSTQTINTGSKVNALNLKNIEQFKGLKPFVVLDENQIFDLYDSFGVYETKDIKDFKINVGDLVNYNNRNFIVLGIVVNTYAQWNLPTPLLFNPSGISNDVKSLYGSKLTDEEIVSKINDNFQKGKYDSDIIIPLVDMAKPKDIIKVVKQNISDSETLEIFSKIEKLKKADFKIEKDVFINTIADLKAQEIMSLKSTNEELYDKFNLVVKSINDVINKKIADLPAQPKEKPARKPRAKKVIEEVVKKDLPDFIDKDMPITDLPEQVKKLVILRNSEQESSFNFDLKDTIQFAFNWDNTPEGVDFWSEINNYGDLREFKKLYGNKGEKVDDLIAVSEMPKTTSVEPETKKGELPDSFDVVRTLVKDLPKGLYELTIFEALKQGRQTIAEIMNSKLIVALDWATTEDGADFWIKINNGDLTEFKEKYGAKGELAITMYEDFMKKRESAIADKQDVLGVNFLFYPPKGGYITIETDNLYELYDATIYLLKQYKRDKLQLNFGTKTKDDIYKTKIWITSTISQDEFLSLLIEKFDTFVIPELDWSDFDARLGDIDKIELNKKIINEALEPKPVEVEKPKPVEVEKPKPKAIKPKPVVAEKPKPVKVAKPKATKPKVKDELSFLDDLDNIL